MLNWFGYDRDGRDIDIPRTQADRKTTLLGTLGFLCFICLSIYQVIGERRSYNLHAFTATGTVIKTEKKLFTLFSLTCLNEFELTYSALVEYQDHSNSPQIAEVEFCKHNAPLRLEVGMPLTIIYRPEVPNYALEGSLVRAQQHWKLQLLYLAISSILLFGYACYLSFQLWLNKK